MSTSKSAQNISSRKAPAKTTRTPASAGRRKTGVAKPKPAQKNTVQGTKTKQLKSRKPKKLVKEKKEKLIRDNFTMPKQEFEKIAELKERCSGLGLNIKKSVLLRAGLHALSKLTPQQLKAAVSKVEKI